MFEKIYVVCLDERREYIKNYLNNFEFKSISKNFKEIEIVSAVKAKDISKEFLKSKGFKVLKQFRDPNSGRVLSKGEIACTLSHFKVWKKIANSNAKYALILEDDVEFCKGFEKKFKSIMSEVKEKNKPLDFLYLGRKKFGKKQEKKFTKNLSYSENSWWTCAYVASNNFATQMLKGNFSKKIIPADNLLLAAFDSYYDKRVAKHFSNEKLDIFPPVAVNENLIYPKNNSFKDSKTETLDFVNVVKDTVKHKGYKIKVVTVATDSNCGLNRLKQSCLRFGVQLVILGEGEEWKGGDVRKNPGGAHKIFLLKEYLRKCDKEDLILFTDAYDAVISGSPYEIIDKFDSFGSKIVFSSEYSCWPDPSRAHEYPDAPVENRFLNSGGFIGRAKDIDKIIELKKLRPGYDDQRYYTTKFLEELSQPSSKMIRLDYECSIFQTLNGAQKDVSVNFRNSRLYNHKKNNYPCVVHANGPQTVKSFFNGLTNFFPGKFYGSYGFLGELEKASLIDKSIYVNIFMNKFKVDNISFLNGIISQKYPKNLVSLNFFCKNIEKKKIQEVFAKNLEDYNQVSWNTNLRDGTRTRNTTVKDFIESGNDLYLNIDNSFCLENKNTFSTLAQSDKPVIAPMLNQKLGYWSTFWYDIDKNGYYKHNTTYYRILSRELVSVFNVPYVYGCYMVKKPVFDKLGPEAFKNENFKDKDYLYALCQNLRDENIFMYVTNTDHFGTLSQNYLDYNLSEVQKYYTLENDWKEKYLHASLNSEEDITVDRIGSDIFSFPIFSKAFCKEMVALAEAENDWQKDRHKNYPTTDVTANKLRMDNIIKDVYDSYLVPLVRSLFSYNTPLKDVETFVSKYSSKPDSQGSLDSHCDNSTFSVIITLNDDFEGGGTFFERQKIDKILPPVGSALIFPGRLTHPHGELPVTKGDRYVLVSFCK